jgi:tRNA-splicing ligase RtcB
MPPTSTRLLRALAREGLEVHRDGPLYRVRLSDQPDVPFAEVLLPDSLPVESAALRQLAELAAVRHPAGGRVRRTFATPDFHPGDGGVAIGSVVETDDLIIPAAVGTDINCGMRLHVVDLPAERFSAGRNALVEKLKGDLFYGTRDLPQDGKSFRALFHEGLPGWVTEVVGRPKGSEPLGRLAQADGDQLERELDHVHLGGGLSGNARWAPEGLLPEQGMVRDPGLATVGGGNHFIEIQLVEEVADRAQAYAWGVREGQLAMMIHSGSRDVGKHIGTNWKDKARAAWPQGTPLPESGMISLSRKHTPELVDSYLEAEATAANYAFANRLLLAELVRLRLREVFGEVEAPLVYDLPHNLTFREDDRTVIRKGACPAHAGQPVIIPGSMGAPSFLLVGQGAESTLCSASHGAGRAKSRFSMSRGGADNSEEALGLNGVDCVTLREERRIEEAPAAYKPIGPVIEAQVEAGAVRVVAKLRPILTFKA